MIALLLTLAAFDSATIQARPPSVRSGLPVGSDYPMVPGMTWDRGRTDYRLTVDERGHAVACEVAESSGSARLDEAGCRIFLARTVFVPARDVSGVVTRGTLGVPITWRPPIATPIQTSSWIVAVDRDVDGQLTGCSTRSEGMISPAPPRLDPCETLKIQVVAGEDAPFPTFVREHRPGERLRFTMRVDQVTWTGVDPAAERGQVQKVLVLRSRDANSCATWQIGRGPITAPSTLRDCVVVDGSADADAASGIGPKVLVTNTLAVQPAPD